MLRPLGRRRNRHPTLRSPHRARPPSVTSREESRSLAAGTEPQEERLSLEAAGTRPARQVDGGCTIQIGARAEGLQATIRKIYRHSEFGRFFSVRAGWCVKPAWEMADCRAMPVDGACSHYGTAPLEPAAVRVRYTRRFIGSAVGVPVGRSRGRARRPRGDGARGDGAPSRLQSLIGAARARRGRGG